MLAQKSQTLPYIGVFKLNSGEEFIAKVINDTSVFYEVKKPLCMVATDSGVQFAPLMMMGDIEATVFISKPVTNTTPDKRLEEQYEAAISPILVPKKSAIITG